VRLEVNASQLTGFSDLVADDARALEAVTVPALDPADVGHRGLAVAMQDFEAIADAGAAQVLKAGQALSDWMSLAAEVAKADDDALAAEFRASGGKAAPPTRNRGAEAAAGGGT
jgi:hypothetical protein